MQFGSGSVPITTQQKATWALIAVCLLVLVWPLLSLGSYLLGVDYYQHFPLLVIGAGVLAYFRWRELPLPYAGVLSPRTTIWLVLGVLAAAGVFALPSRWLSAPAAFALVAAAVVFGMGRGGARLMLGPLLLLAAAIPLPATLAESFVVWLQQVATRMASLALEVFRIPHDATGVAIRTGAHDYFVEEACSGVNSVYAALALGVTYAAVKRYRLLRTTVLLAQLTFWVIIANAARVFAMVALKERFSIDLIDSSLHEMVGAVTFLAGVLLAFSWDCFLRYVVPPKYATLESWHAYVRAINEARWLDRSISARTAWGLIAALAITAGSVTVLLYRYETPQGREVAVSELVDSCCVDLDEIDVSFLPESLGGWRQAGFHTEARDPESVFGGMVSFQWAYINAAGRGCTVQIDGPYTSWHDLTVCYRGAGWDIEDVVNLRDEQFAAANADDALAGANRSESEWEASEILLAKGVLERGHSIFLCLDQPGQNIRPPRFHSASRSINSLGGRLAAIFGERRRVEGGAIQIQVFDTKPGDFSSDERVENRELFWLAAEALRDRLEPAGPLGELAWAARDAAAREREAVE